jgi:hypothetical protein
MVKPLLLPCLLQVESVYSRLGGSTTRVEAAQSHLASLKAQAAEAAAVAEAAQVGGPAFDP